jgi:hypothetical protein
VSFFPYWRFPTAADSSHIHTHAQRARTWRPSWGGCSQLVNVYLIIHIGTRKCGLGEAFSTPLLVDIIAIVVFVMTTIIIIIIIITRLYTHNTNIYFYFIIIYYIILCSRLSLAHDDVACRTNYTMSMLYLYYHYTLYKLSDAIQPSFSIAIFFLTRRILRYLLNC